MRVVFHPEAHAEMIEQAQYYESKSERLGSDFLDALRKLRSGFPVHRTLAQLIEQTFGSDSFPAFRLQFSTKSSQIESTSRQ